MAGLTALLGVGCILLLRNSVQTPIERVVHAASRVAGGDLESRFVSHGRDEIAWLNSELNKMRKKLRDALLVAAQAADAVRACADDIAQGSVDLSTRTECQAATLQQTASSMDTLTTAVRGNAEQALRTNDLVKIAGIAQAGREQSQNLGAVNQAITQVDTVTQQNAALVEQTTATAGSLKEQSEHLADTIRKFKLTA